MRSLQRAVRGTYAPGFYGREREFTVIVRLDAPEAQEAGRVRIAWKNLPQVTASRIGLPDFFFLGKTFPDEKRDRPSGMLLGAWSSQFSEFPGALTERPPRA